MKIDKWERGERTRLLGRWKRGTREEENEKPKERKAKFINSIPQVAQVY